MIAPPLAVRAARAGLALAAAAVLLAGVVRAQRPPPPIPPDELEMRVTEWRSAVRAHVGGQFDGPAASIAGWPSRVTDAVVAHAIRGRTQDPQSIAKGLILHTDIAIAERTNRTGTAGRAVVVADARPVSAISFSIHWGFARRLAVALAADRRGVAQARAWYRAAGALHQQWADLGVLRAHLDDGIDRFKDDAVLWLYAGTLHQAFADARVQHYLAEGRQEARGASIRIVRHDAIGAADAELRAAEHALRRAAAIDPTLMEARIRLAHVLSLRGAPAEAAPLARQALEAPLRTFLDYYASMVLGRIEAQLGRHAEARAAFERAAARYPHSQVTQVALSHVADSPGAACADLVRALGPDAAESPDDPWASYFRIHEPDAQTQLAALRTSVP